MTFSAVQLMSRVLNAYYFAILKDVCTCPLTLFHTQFIKFEINSILQVLAVRHLIIISV